MLHPSSGALWYHDVTCLWLIATNFLSTTRRVAAAAAAVSEASGTAESADTGFSDECKPVRRRTIHRTFNADELPQLMRVSLSVLFFMPPPNVRGAFKKFCNSTIKRNGNVTNYTLYFNIIPTEFNAFATFFWQTVNSSKIEIFSLSLQTSFLSISSP